MQRHGIHPDAATPMFAYGSNLCRARLEARVGLVRVGCRCRLLGYRLVFDKVGRDGTGKATVIPSVPSAFVQGVVYDLSAAQMSTLDGFERGYDRQSLTLQIVEPQHLAKVKAVGEPSVENPVSLTAWVYLAPPACRNAQLQPYRWYTDFIRQGTVEHGLNLAITDTLLQELAPLEHSASLPPRYS